LHTNKQTARAIIELNRLLNTYFDLGLIRLSENPIITNSPIGSDHRKSNNEKLLFE